jgi:uncharacterized cupin superfamily protein
MAVHEAPLRSTRFGLVPNGEGWFVLNAAETRWRDYGPLGVACDFEGKRPFKQVGININVLNPGEPLSMYHRENHQEGFLVLAGECLLIVEGQERALTAWDFFHCPGGTTHAIVGAGDGPAVVLAVGARGGRKGIIYLAEPVALTRGAGVNEQTTESTEAYAPFPPAKRCPYRAGWLPQFSRSVSPLPSRGHGGTSLS